MTQTIISSCRSLPGSYTQYAFRVMAAGLILALAATIAQAQTSGDSKPASPSTLEFNKKSTASLPWSDNADFANAKRGLIARLPDSGVIKDRNGRIVWDLSRFTGFIKDGAAAPDTVNPSLWRMSQLLMEAGLYEVVPGVYQVRGADLSNLTIIEGEQGLTIYDPLISAETARAALDLYYQNRPRKSVVAVIYSHSHVDHAGGVRGIVDEADVKSGKVRIFAPEGFLENFVAENLFAGQAMGRRASYMYGNLVAPGPQGSVTAGLGVTTSSGRVTLIAPTDLITKTGEKRVIDGIEYEFLLAPGSEAPAEMMWYLPKFKLINTAEDATRTMHNLYTLRGAKTRDARLWPMYLNQALQMWGDQYDVQITMHHWPTWGNNEITQLLKVQRDTYKFMHDQTLHYANMGYTMRELPGLVTLPQSLANHWASQGYYGTQSHNVRAVYNFYLGYFDGNPATLNPLPPVEVAGKYVAAMGGPDAVMKLGREAFEKGDYRWGAELVNHLVFAQPDNQEAKNLQADILEQMGYQAESGPWRGFYLTGTDELRHGVKKRATGNPASADIVASMSPELLFGYMGVQLDARKADGKTLAIDWIFPDINEKHALFLENSVLNHWPDYTNPKADVTVTVDRTTLTKVLTKQVSFEDAVKTGQVKFAGNQAKFGEFMGYLVDLNQYFWFNIVTP
ncbi:alkyl sulfatase dimerization domain-containing protein [Bradyrhizobium sp. Leo170]|uniref:alkyl/aryl-sulfatase n=1 Tax=Bradyrhizobium sp. Leo170 TaxID=1571199 RepID=UPI001FDF3748|nr:alkyl sulfatase dimerization domain-containing protein [Bradyrhizobium sp. Leo170]